MSDARMVAAALLLAGLAGCLEAPAVTLAAVGDDAPIDVLSFLPPVAFSGSGAPVELAADRLAALPWGIEQLVPLSGAEPNLGVTSSGAIFVTTFDQVQRSRDHGVTWEVVHDFVSPGSPTIEDKFTTADPMLWVDQDTDRVFVNQMHPALFCTYMAWSDDEGETWTERAYACGIPGIDHQKVMTAPSGPRALVGPVVYPNVVHVCNNKRLDVFDGYGMGTSCFVSLDGGLTYPYETAAYVNDKVCGNVNGHPAAYPDGTVVMIMGNLGKECVRPLTAALTEDNGLTWQTRVCDERIRQLEIDADITVTPDGTAYALYRDLDNVAHMLRTRDKFQTCETWRVAPPDHTLSVFAGITSGDDGRVAMAYLGTRDAQEPGTIPSNATPGTQWHAFVTTSFDADTDDPTFVTQQITPEQDPVQVGCIWLSGGGGGPHECRNLLDFIDMVRDLEGRWYVAITDGCTPRNGCTGSPAQSDGQSRDAQIAILVQDRGESLFAEFGVLPSLGLAPPQPFPEEIGTG